MLARAILDVLDGDESAMSWILNDRDDYVFSFVNCCRIIGLHPENVRRRVLDGQAEVLRKLLFVL